MAPDRLGSGSQTPTLQNNNALQPTPSIDVITKIPLVLPHERVFPIQIGSELFKLSGASLSSDGVYLEQLPTYPLRDSAKPPPPAFSLSPSQRKLPLPDVVVGPSASEGSRRNASGG